MLTQLSLFFSSQSPVRKMPGAPGPFWRGSGVVVVGSGVVVVGSGVVVVVCGGILYAAMQCPGCTILLHFIK